MHAHEILITFSKSLVHIRTQEPLLWISDEHCSCPGRVSHHPGSITQVVVRQVGESVGPRIVYNIHIPISPVCETQDTTKKLLPCRASHLRNGEEEEFDEDVEIGGRGEDHR